MVIWGTGATDVPPAFLKMPTYPTHNTACRKREWHCHALLHGVGRLGHAVAILRDPARSLLVQVEGFDDAAAAASLDAQTPDFPPIVRRRQVAPSRTSKSPLCSQPNYSADADDAGGNLPRSLQESLQAASRVSCASRSEGTPEPAAPAVGVPIGGLGRGVFRTPHTAPQANAQWVGPVLRHQCP